MRLAIILLANVFGIAGWSVVLWLAHKAGYGIWAALGWSFLCSVLWGIEAGLSVAHSKTPQDRS